MTVRYDEACQETVVYMNVGGSGERLSSGLPEESFFHEQTISPDGKKIAFTGHSKLENGYDDALSSSRTSTSREA